MVNNLFRHNQRRLHTDNFRIVQGISNNNVLVNHQAHQHTAGTLFGQLNADHHTSTAYFLDNGRIFRSDSLQTSLKISACLTSATQHILFLNSLDSCYTGSAGQLVTAKGRGVQKRCFNKTGPGTRSTDNRTYGHYTAAQSLSAGHQVGSNAVMINAEPFAGTADTGLYLIGNQQSTLLLADFLHLTQVTRRRNNNAAFALNRLQDNSSSILINSYLNSCSVAVFYMGKAIKQRFKRLAVHITSGSS